jgi:glycosyltransferase involved in cell wall biosynthesis
MIRLCFMVDAAFLGGAELYVSRLAGALDPSRFAISLVMRETTDAHLVTWANRFAASGVRVVRTPMHLPFRPAHALAIYNILDGLSPHIVHVNMPGPYNGQNGLLVALARLCGARVVTTEHLPMVEGSVKRTLLKALVYGGVDCAVTVSHANAVLLRERQGVPASRIRVVYNGIEPPLAHQTRPEQRVGLGVGSGDVLVWYVGNILRHKGLEDVIAALSRVRMRDWRLAVVGDGPDRPAAERCAAEAGLADRVRFLGHQAPEAVRALLPAGDLLVLPSRMEGLPYTILEAMAAGLPVVSTRVFGIPEAVVDDETGILVAPGDGDALTHALEILLGDASLRVRMGAAARARFEAHFTLHRQASVMTALYEELYTGRSAG